MRLIDAEKVVHEYYKNPSYQQLCKEMHFQMVNGVSKNAFVRLSENVSKFMV